jgi:hypothetical protein
MILLELLQAYTIILIVCVLAAAALAAFISRGLS